MDDAHNPVKAGEPHRRADALIALGLTRDASDEDIRAAFRLRVRHAHPDVKGGTDILLRRLILARDLLMSDSKKSTQATELLNNSAPSSLGSDRAIDLTITVDQAIHGGEIFTDAPAFDVSNPAALTSLTQMTTLRVRLPSGLRHGDRVHLKSEGGTDSTSLFSITILTENDCRVSGHDIWMTAAVETRLFFGGGDAVIQTPHGPLDIHIDRGFERGSSLCLPGKGLPATDTAPAGNLHVRLEAGANAVRPVSEVLQQFRQRWAS